MLRNLEFYSKHVSQNQTHLLHSRLSSRSIHKSHWHCKASLNKFYAPSQADDEDLERGRDHIIRSDLIQQLMRKATFKYFFFQGNMIKLLKVPGANKQKPNAKGV